MSAYHNMGDDLSRPVPYKIVDLHKVRYQVEQVLSHETLQDVTLRDVVIEEMMNAVKFRFNKHVWAETKTTRIKYPETWWDAFKAAYAPGWFLKRWPVNYTTHHVNFDIIYPDFKPVTEPFLTHQNVRIIRDSEGELF